MSDPTRTVTTPDAPVTHSLADGAATTAGGGGSPGTTSAPFAPPGYDLGEEVGSGGMGVVYRARDRELKREVAVKILLPKYAPHSATARRFVDEAQITSQLQHPGVPPVYRVGHLPDGRPFLAMKLIKGNTLAELLTSRDRQGAESGRWLGVFEGICQAVGYAHAHHVVHRDLKPANVMVGSFGEVQVMDWGLAKVLLPSPPGGRGAGGEGAQDPDATASLDPTEIKSLRDAETQAGSLLGTPAFMAPEQAIGAVDQIDRRTDVFGLGAILCSLLTGKPPYVGDSAESTRLLAARAKLDDAFARLDSCGAEPDLVALAKRCLSAEKADRPADARELAQAVAALRQAADDRARRAEIDREKAEVESREQRKRRRVVQWAGGVVAGVLLAGVVGTAIGLVRAENRRVEADQARGREADRADEREKAYAKTADVLDVMVSAVTGESLATQATITAEQKRFLTEVLSYYQEFAAATGGDEPTRRRTAQAAVRVGIIEQRLGRKQEGAAAFERARDGYVTLSSDFPDNPEYRRELGRSQHNLGLLLYELGRVVEAREQYTAAVAIREQLAADYSERADFRVELARSHNNLGVLLSPPTNPAADEHLRKALALREQLVADFPAVPEYRRELAESHNSLGMLLLGCGKAAEAQHQYTTAVALLEKLTADFLTPPRLPHGSGHEPRQPGDASGRSG